MLAFGLAIFNILDISGLVFPVNGNHSIDQLPGFYEINSK